MVKKICMIFLIIVIIGTIVWPMKDAMDALITSLVDPLNLSEFDDFLINLYPVALVLLGFYAIFVVATAREMQE